MMMLWHTRVCAQGTGPSVDLTRTLITTSMSTLGSCLGRLLARLGSRMANRLPSSALSQAHSVKKTCRGPTFNLYLELLRDLWIQDLCFGRSYTKGSERCGPKRLDTMLALLKRQIEIQKYNRRSFCCSHHRHTWFGERQPQAHLSLKSNWPLKRNKPVEFFSTTIPQLTSKKLLEILV